MKQRQISMNYKANLRMQVGAIVKGMLVSAVTLACTGGSVAGFAAWQSPKTVLAVNNDQSVAALETVLPENEHLWKQSADSEQNLRVTSQKLGVNEVRLQNSWNLNAPVYSVTLSPDGQIIASGSGLYGTIKLWKLDGTLIKTLKAHKDLVSSISFSPDGQIIASSAVDGTIKLWKQDGTLITTLKGDNISVISISFSPDGQTLVSGGNLVFSNSNDKSIKLWNLNEVASQK